MKVQQISLISVALLLLSAISLNASQLASAKVVEVVGTVSKYSGEGPSTPLSMGDILKQGDSVSATALSEAKLVFSNGSELTIEENTSITIAELQQDPFSGGQSYEQLQADPSKSQTLLELNYGSLSGHVKELRADSKFHVETPLGTAAIRGTVWNALLIYNAERGEFLFTVKNVDGIVDILSKFGGQLEYTEGNVADKSFDSSLGESTKAVIPPNHTVVLRIGRGDPLFDDLFSLIQNTQPTGPKPVITPGTPQGIIIEDETDDKGDLGIIIVSPELPAAVQQVVTPPVLIPAQ